ncbi:MAG TPA: hypothetical protein VGC56_07175 [Allosphingosinicella sp.]|jgi:hypothetical protein
MKHARRTRSRNEVKAPLRRFSGRNEPPLARRPYNPYHFKPIPGACVTPIETIVQTWPLEGFSEVMIDEHGAVTRRPILTVVVDKRSRAILGWHMS